MTKRKPKTAKPQIEPVIIDLFVAEQKRLLKRVQKLTRRIRQLKIRHNALSPINRLPPELLIRIFSSLQSDFRAQDPDEYYKWTVVTHISHLWRVVALEAKQLWTGVSFNEQQVASPWVMASIERSRPLDLCMAITFDLNRPIIGILDIIRKRNHQIRTLCIGVIGTNGRGDYSLVVLLDVLAKTTMPVLEDFELMGFEGHRLSLTLNTAPITLFNSFAPNLAAILVQDVNITLKTIPFVNITCLELEYEPGDPGIVSFSTLFDVLQTTSLQCLDLTHALVDSGDSADDSPTHPIPLPSLVHLELDLPVHQCVRLLSHVVIPTTCRCLITGVLNPLNAYPNPKSLFDATLPRLCTNPTEITGVQVHVAHKSILFRMRRPDAMPQHRRWGPSSFEIRSVFPAEEPRPTLVLPELAQFSNVWWVWLTCETNYATSSVIKSPASLVDELISKIWDLESLDDLVVSPSFIPLISRHLVESSARFPGLTRISIKRIGPQHLELFDDFAKAIYGWKRVWKKRVKRVRVDGDDDAWIEETLIPYLADRLVGCCDVRSLVRR